MAAASCDVVVAFVCGMLLLVVGSLVDAGSIGRSHRNQYSGGHALAAADESKTDRPADRLTLRFTTPEHGKVELTLKRVDHSERNVPTYISGRNGKMVRMQDEQGYSLTSYADESSQASIVVERRKNSGGRTVKRYRGSFNVGNKLYWLAPVMARSSRSKAGRDRFQPHRDSVRVSIAGVEHFVAPTDTDKDMFRAYDNIVQSSAKVEVSDENPHYEQRDKANYIVELLIVMDHSLYQFWHDMYTGEEETDQQRLLTTALLLRHYFAVISRGINNRYTAIQESDFSIQVKLIGFFIATDIDDSQYSEGPDVKLIYNDLGYTKMGPCLTKFGLWIKDMATNYGAFDHAVLYVGNFLYDVLEDGRPQTKSGLANMAGVCDRANGRCTSINFERGFYSSIQTGAHELAHNLGSPHDGENNECKGADQFVMAAAPGELNEANFNNPYKFSQCSIRKMRDTLAGLTSANKNCLLTLESTVDLQIAYKLPGVIQGVDQQCMNFEGPDSFYCAGMINDAQLCEKIYCWDVDRELCTSGTEHRAYSGTMCGNHKWCLSGKCVADSEAEAGNDTCTYGDYHGLVYIDDDHKTSTCIELITQFPEKCYQEHHFKQCCNSCPSIRRLDTPDCEYGDRTPPRCVNAKPDHCYTESFRLDCCDWCQKQEGTDPKCLFGDHADWCQTATSEALDCYTNHETCCIRCDTLSTGIAGCEYGDKVTWCASQQLDANSCQPSTDIGKQCCGSCAAKFPGGIMTDAEAPSAPDKPVQTDATANCPQGDKGSHCKVMTSEPSRCYDDKDCCATCEKLSSGMRDCEYGDRMGGCMESGIDLQYCNEDAEMAKLCCKTCHDLGKQKSLKLIGELLDELRQ